MHKATAQGLSPELWLRLWGCVVCLPRGAALPPRCSALTAAAGPPSGPGPQAPVWLRTERHCPSLWAAAASILDGLDPRLSHSLRHQGSRKKLVVGCLLSGEQLCGASSRDWWPLSCSPFRVRGLGGVGVVVGAAQWGQCSFSLGHEPEVRGACG